MGVPGKFSYGGRCGSSAKTHALMAEHDRWRPPLSAATATAGTESRGSRKGAIVEPRRSWRYSPQFQKAGRSRRSVRELTVEHAIVGIGEPVRQRRQQPRRHQPGHAPHDIGRDEIKQAVDRARAIPLPADREIASPAAAKFHPRRTVRRTRSTRHDGSAPGSPRPHGDRRD